MPEANSLPPLRDVLEHHGLSAKKSLGQHFLLDMNLTRKIVRHSGLKSSDHAIEVGPGPGGLSRAILETGARLDVIERDDRCLQILQDLAASYPSQLKIHAEDALSTDYTAFGTESNAAHFISNLPYNISTELLVRWLSRPNCWQSMTLMFQREVADRLLADVGTKAYGRLSVLAQTMAEPAKGFDLPPQAFTPPPKIFSTIVCFKHHKTTFPAVTILENLTQHAFSQRRKMIRTSLKNFLGNQLGPLLEKVNIAPTARAEDLDPIDYQNLALAVATTRH